MSITVQLKGFDGLAARLQANAQKVFEQVDAEIGAGVQEMVPVAKRNAPADQGLLRNEISFEQNSFLKWTYVSQASYSAFVEFGTKSQVSIPPGLESFAAQFKGGGFSSLDAKAMIFEWCKRHGIERKAWYAIFIKIMTIGVRPQPFFFPAFEEVKPKMIQNIRNIL